MFKKSRKISKSVLALGILTTLSLTPALRADPDVKYDMWNDYKLTKMREGERRVRDNSKKVIVSESYLKNVLKRIRALEKEVKEKGEE